MERTGAWSTDLASLMKNREKEGLGNTLGEVVSVSPLKVSVLKGQIILDATIHEIYVSNRLIEEATNTTTTQDTDQTFEPEGEAKCKETLENGDIVMVFPDENEQTFFITDIMKKV